jgi:hypothetical protein
MAGKDGESYVDGEGRFWIVSHGKWVMISKGQIILLKKDKDRLMKIIERFLTRKKTINIQNFIDGENHE